MTLSSIKLIGISIVTLVTLVYSAIWFDTKQDQENMIIVKKDFIVFDRALFFEIQY